MATKTFPQRFPQGLRQIHGSWHYRARVREVGADGREITRRVSVKLGSVKDYPTLRSINQKYLEAAAEHAEQATRPTSTMTMSEFWRSSYWPHCQATTRPASQQTYRYCWEFFLEGVLGKLPLRNVRRSDILLALERVARTHAQSTVARCRITLSAALARACELDLIEHNPVRDCKTPRSSVPRKTGAAYTMRQVETMLGILPGRARVAVALLFYTGARPSEIAGLEWADYDGEQITIRRSVWKGTTGPTKTLDGSAKVPVIAPLREILESWRPQTPGFGLILFGDTGNPLHWNNVKIREVAPVLEKYRVKWLGWYAFRRGAATVLSDDLGMSEERIRSVLRHAPGSSVAHDHYIVREERKRAGVMAEFERHVLEVREDLKNQQRPN